MAPRTSEQTNCNTRLFAIVASIAALTLAGSGLRRSSAEAPKAPFQLVQEDNQSCANGVGFTGNCNSINFDISTDFVLSSVQDPNAPFPLAPEDSNNLCGSGPHNFLNCKAIALKIEAAELAWEAAARGRVSQNRLRRHYDRSAPGHD